MLLHSFFTFITFTSAFSVIPGTGYLPAVVRAGCRSALSENIASCSDLLRNQPKYIDASSLEKVCTPACKSSLSAMYTKATTACGTRSINITSNGTSVRLVPLDLAGEVPLREGGFCKTKLENLTEAGLCSECFMKKIQLDMSEPLGTFESFTPAEFNEIKQSCGIPTSSYPVKSTPSATPGPSPTCTRKVTGKKGDTVNSIAKANSVSTDRLLGANSHLPAAANNTLVGGEIICLDSVQKCMVKQIVDGDSCGILTKAAGKGVDVVMLQSWNPTIGSECRNVKAMVGKYICISPPGTSTPFVPVEGKPKPTITTTSTSESSWSFGSVPNTATSSINFTTSWNFPTDPVSISTMTQALPASTAINSAIARRSNCPFLKEDTPEWQAGLADDEYHLRSDDLPFECIASWEPYCLPAITGPILPSPTNIASSCYPTISTIIPDGFVKPPKPTQTGTSPDCNKWHVVKTGDNCAKIESKYKITHANFLLWNKAINAGCTNVIADMAYCVRIWVEPPEESTTEVFRSSTAVTSKTSSGVSKPSSVVSRTSSSAGPPGPTQSGTSGTCTKWHLHKQGDTCDSIAALYGIIVSRLRQLNRSVNSACSNLVVGSAYCVG